MNATGSEVKRAYERLTIANIQNGEAVRANTGNVTVKLALNPELWAEAGHRFVVLLEGQERQRSQASTVELVNLDRGQHTLQGMVIDADGRELIRSEPVTFYIKRVSALPPQR